MKVFQEQEQAMVALFNKAGIRVDNVTLTRVTVLVKVYDKTAADKVADLLNKSGQWKVKVSSPDETFCKAWTVGGVMVFGNRQDKLDALKVGIDAGENKNHMIYIAQRLGDMFKDRSRLVSLVMEYHKKFGDKGIKALVLGIQANFKDDVLHDLAGQNNKFFEPRTLELWGEE